MNLCCNDHEEICYEGRVCPMCQTIREKDREIEYLKEAVAGLKEDIASRE